MTIWVGVYQRCITHLFHGVVIQHISCCVDFIASVSYRQQVPGFDDFHSPKKGENHFFNEAAIPGLVA